MEKSLSEMTERRWCRLLIMMRLADYLMAHKELEMVADPHVDRAVRRVIRWFRALHRTYGVSYMDAVVDRWFGRSA